MYEMINDASVRTHACDVSMHVYSRLDPQQFESTIITQKQLAMAIMELEENITNAMDNGKFTISVFIDLKKAFDTVDHIENNMYVLMALTLASYLLPVVYRKAKF